MVEEEELGSVDEDLGKAGENPRVSGMLFKAVMQAVLIFVSETWVINPCMVWSLKGFKHRVDIQITRSQPRRLLYVSWGYPPLETVMQEVGFEEVEEYVLSRHNTIAQYIATLPIMELYK